MASTDTAVYLYIDCETIPTQNPDLIAEIEAKHHVPDLDLSAIVADGRLTDLDKINADIRKKQNKAIADHEAAVAKAVEAAEAEYRKTCLDATTGHLAAISWAFDADPIVGTRLALAPVADSDSGYPIEADLSNVIQLERQLLTRFFDAIVKEVDNRARAAAGAEWDRQAENWKHTHVSVFDRDGFIKKNLGRFRLPLIPIVVAHHAAFDLRYIWQRAIILGVEVPAWWPHDAKPWDDKRVQDTMILWAGVGNRIGLDRLCRALGIEGKGDMDGSKVWDAVREGRIAEVAEYCSADVERLRAVHRRIKGWPDIPTLEEVLEEEEADVRAEADAQRRYESGRDA